MGATETLIGILNSTQDERIHHNGGVEGWADSVAKLVVDARNEFDKTPNRDERFAAAVQNALAPGVGEETADFFNTLIETANDDDITEQAQKLATRLRREAEAGNLPIDPDEEDAPISKSAKPHLGSPDSIIEKLKKGDASDEMVRMMLALRKNENAFVGYGQPNPVDPKFDIPREIGELAQSPKGQEMGKYLRDILENNDQAIHDVTMARPDNKYGGQVFRSLSQAGLGEGDVLNVRRLKPGMEVLISGATPEEMKDLLTRKITEDLVNGNFPGEFKFSGDNAEARSAEANSFARKFVNDLDAKGVFTKSAYAIQNPSTGRQTIGFRPNDDALQLAAGTLMQMSGTDAHLPDRHQDMNLSEEFFKDHLPFTSAREEDTLKAEFREMQKKGEISIFGRGSVEKSFEALDKVIDDVAEKMHAGDLNGSFIGTSGWDRDKYAQLMREGMEQAGLYFQAGASGPVQAVQLTVHDPAHPEILNYGEPVQARLSEVDLSVRNPENGDILFKFKDDIEIFRVEGDETTGAVTTKIETTDNQVALGDVTPLELRNLLQGGNFTIKPTFEKTPDGASGDQFSIYIEAGGNKFHVTPMAFEEGSVSTDFQERMKKPEDTTSQDVSNVSPAVVMSAAGPR